VIYSMGSVITFVENTPHRIYHFRNIYVLILSLLLSVFTYYAIEKGVSKGIHKSLTKS
jgi:hypothetical protein